MPRYDYECDSCHHRFELKQSFDSEPVATCPMCEHSARRKFHSVPVVFKGSGWYVNDYGKRGTGAGAPTEAKESAEPAEKSSKSSKSEGDGDGKSASKAEGKSDSKAEGGSGAGATSDSKAKSETSKAKSD